MIVRHGLPWELDGPGRETVRRVVPVADLAPRWAARLPDRLAGATTWFEHFAILVRRYAGESPTALARAKRPAPFTAMGVPPCPIS